MYPYRVFLSYWSTERTLAMRVKQALQKLGLHVWWDHMLEPGRPFSEEIKVQIARSHLFLPLLTPDSIVRPWLHQETGFAMGASVPVLPIVVGDVEPVALIEQLHALRVHRVAELKNGLTEAVIHRRVEEAAESRPGIFECIDLPERRSQVIARYAREAQRNGGGRIRHRGAMTSFALPDLPPDDPIWRERDGKVHRSRYLHEQQHQERLALGKLAAKYRCDLVISPSIPLKENGPKARRIRLETLKQFLLDEQAYPDVNVVVQDHDKSDNLLIVGDFFCAESITPEGGVGYKQTIFTWHAPTVLAKLREFDSQFARSAGRKSRQDAVAAIDREMKDLA
ncbi:MAG: toll/interleukin-1 receptor domain-containing protein [Thermoanaerobaculia bacterium]